MTGTPPPPGRVITEAEDALVEAALIWWRSHGRLGPIDADDDTKYGRMVLAAEAVRVERGLTEDD